MARKNHQYQKGQLVNLTHTSRILADNPLGDPAQRVVQAYLPAAYNQIRRAKRKFITLYDLVGYSGAGPSHTNWKNFDENVPEQLDRLIHEGKLPPCIVIFPDCFTALGGNQYINSSAIGRYADYLTKEIVPFIDTEFRTYAQAQNRGCFGKSSGGYGAIVHGMRYPQTWGAVANHSGDSYFDFVYRTEWPQVLTELQKYQQPVLRPGQVRRAKKQQRPGVDDGRIARFLEQIYTNPKPSGKDVMTLMMICMAATYDPYPRAPLGFRLPYDLHSGEFLEQRWRAWLKHDPIHMVARYKANLAKLRGVYIDCGWRDQFHIHFGTRQLSAQLTKHKIKHRYEEFDDTHSGVDYRMDVSLPFLARALR